MLFTLIVMLDLTPPFTSCNSKSEEADCFYTLHQDGSPCNYHDYGYLHHPT